MFVPLEYLEPGVRLPPWVGIVALVLLALTASLPAPRTGANAADHVRSSAGTMTADGAAP